MSVVKNLKIRFKNNTGDEYETIENTREIPISTENTNLANNNLIENNFPNSSSNSAKNVVDNLPVTEGNKRNKLQKSDNYNEDSTLKRNFNTEKKETNKFLPSDNVKEIANKKNISSSKDCNSKDFNLRPDMIQKTRERSVNSSSNKAVDRDSSDSDKHSNEMKFPQAPESRIPVSKNPSNSSKTSNNDICNDKESLEKMYNPEDKDEYRRHIEAKMSQLWMLVDDFGKASTQYTDKKFFDFEDFCKNEENYRNLSYEELTNCMKNAYTQLENINDHINTKTDLSKKYKADMIVQATYLKDQLCRLEKYTDQQELENEERRNKVEKRLEAFYKKSIDNFKECKINITLDEFKEIFDSYHKSRVEKALQGEVPLNDDTKSGDKKNNMENNKENEKRDNYRKENSNSPEEIRNQNIEFIRQITGRYSYTSMCPKVRKEKSSVPKVQNKAQNITQLQSVERKCEYTLKTCPELIRDISRLDYSENGFEGRLNIDTLCQEMRNYLLTHTISRYQFSQKVLGMSGGALNELLNKPRVFEELTEKGITSFLKIRVYLDIVKSKGPYEGKKLSQENITLIKKLNKYYQGK